MANVIKVQKLPRKKTSPEDLLATFCYYFPAYTFDRARKMPYKRIVQMLKTARREEARKNIDLLQIVSSPHGKRGSVKSLYDKFNAIIKE